MVDKNVRLGMDAAWTSVLRDRMKSEEEQLLFQHLRSGEMARLLRALLSLHWPVVNPVYPHRPRAPDLMAV